MNDKTDVIQIFTDGSCNPAFKIGGWAALVIIADQKIALQGKEFNTTHNRMELLSVIKALEYIENQRLTDRKIIINSDSQYVVRIIDRKKKLITNHFLTKKGDKIQNRELVETMIRYIESLSLEFVKVQAHRKCDAQNYNRDVDKTARKIVREHVRKNCIE